MSCSIESALEKLRELAVGRDEDHFLNNAKYDGAGKMIYVEFSWLKQNDKNNVALGHIIINTKKLKIEVNSQERGQKAIAIISRLLGELANYVSMTRIPLEDSLGKIKESGNAQHSPIDLKNEDPQLIDAINSFAKEHWKKWFDEEIPILNNQTPRQAARTNDGRERLEALFLHYEATDAKNPNNMLKADISYLRKELGI